LRPPIVPVRYRGRDEGRCVLAYSTTVYDWIKLVHVLAAIVWVGSSVFIQLYATKLDRSGDRAKLAGFAQDIEFFGGRLSRRHPWWSCSSASSSSGTTRGGRSRTCG
jgi:uncharacterized membrane protein